MRSGIPRYWEYLKTAMTHAIKSYNEHYRARFCAGFEPQPPETDNVTIFRDLDNRMGSIYTRTTVTVTCELRERQVSAQYSDGSKPKLAFAIDSENHIVLKNGERMLDEEGASQFFLEPILFPPEPTA